MINILDIIDKFKNKNGRSIWINNKNKEKDFFDKLDIIFDLPSPHMIKKIGFIYLAEI